jgi:hypothetical protein
MHAARDADQSRYFGIQFSRQKYFTRGQLVNSFDREMTTPNGPREINFRIYFLPVG